MKAASINAASAFLFATGACIKVYNQEVIVIREGGTTALRFEGRTYQVANEEMLSEYEHNSPLRATFMQVNDHNGPANHDIVCMMLQEQQGWIRVQCIH